MEKSELQEVNTYGLVTKVAIMRFTTNSHSTRFIQNNSDFRPKASYSLPIRNPGEGGRQVQTPRSTIKYMKSYRFSPIENNEQLLEAITYTHLKCSKLCKEILEKYLPVAGNIGIFSHYDDEYNFFIKYREELIKIYYYFYNK